MNAAGWVCVALLAGPPANLEAAERPGWAVLIRPHNYDPRDPWDYTRRQGRPAPGNRVDGPLWNRSANSPAVPPQPIPAVIPVPTVEQRVLALGYSVRGAPIVMHVFGTGEQRLLIFAAIHGDEPNTAGVARRLIEELETSPQVPEGCSVAVIPVANPDGLVKRTRQNSREIDLNRNFPARNFAVGKKGRYFGGDEASSEPETLALIKAIELFGPQAIISLHCIARGRHGNNYDGPGESLAAALAEKNGYNVLKSIGYPTPGSFGSWAGVDRQLPTITLELPSDLGDEKAWGENREALLAVVGGAGWAETGK